MKGGLLLGFRIDAAGHLAFIVWVGEPDITIVDLNRRKVLLVRGFDEGGRWIVWIIGEEYLHQQRILFTDQ